MGYLIWKERGVAAVGPLLLFSPPRLVTFTQRHVLFCLRPLPRACVREQEQMPGGVKKKEEQMPGDRLGWNCPRLNFQWCEIQSVAMRVLRRFGGFRASTTVQTVAVFLLQTDN